MKKVAKISSMILIIAIIALVFSNSIVMAASEVLSNLNADYTKDGGLTGIGKSIISYISVAAIVIAVIVLTILGVKYMIGSASEKAEYKKTMIPYLVGAVLVFGAGAIAQVIVSVTSNISATTP